MTIQMVLLPLFVQVLLTFVLFCGMAALRMRAINQGLNWRDIALRQPNWPPQSTQWANAFSNQFEMPVLFYVLTILAWITKQADTLFVIMAWIFVLTRIAQAVVFVTDNNVPRRGLTYFVGVVVLFLMWIIFMARILIAL